jgi:hypothetical protein
MNTQISSEDRKGTEYLKETTNGMEDNIKIDLMM